MKHVLFTLLFAIAGLGVLGASGTPERPAAQAKAASPYPDGKTPVERYGRLRVENRQLVSENGTPIQLRGFSTHDIAGFDWLLSPEYLDQLVQVFHADVIRLAMYTERQGTGYMANPGTFDLMQRVIDDVEKAGLYCIIDWHILSDGNPNKYKTAALDFFDRMSKKYAGRNNIIYELCNEPNGDVAWDRDIRPYAVEVLAAIRKNDPSAIVLVGTPHWSGDVESAARHPIPDSQVMYVFHFYAGGTYGPARREQVAKALQVIPLFCSEWGTTADSGDGPPFPAETRDWLNFLDEHKISSCNWTFSTQAEGSAAFIHSFDFDAPLVDNLSVSGKIVFEYLNSPRPQ